MKKINLILVIFLFFAICNSQEPTSVGKNFVICFPTNDKKDFKDSMSLWLYAISFNGDTVKGTIENSFIKPYKIDFIVAGDSVAQIRIPDTLELSSFKDNEKKAIIVKTDKPIYLFGLSTKLMTSDAFLCLPVNILDTLYTVASSWNVFHDNGAYPGNRKTNTFSNITIVGIEDSTQVKITPTCPVYFPKTTSYKQFVFNINKGETRQVIADVTLENDTSGTNKYDLTGSIVSSTKKIAVFSGHNRAELRPNGPCSTDILIAMSPPVSILSNKLIITPIYSSGSDLNSYLRIIPFFDSTVVSIGDTTVLLKRFSFYSAYYDSALIVKANKPILPAIYERCPVKPAGWLNGDPFLVFPAPPEQFLNEYKFISPPLINFREHFINVIISQKGKQSLRLDGNVLPDSIFRKIAGTNYLWAVSPVSPGSHFIKSDSSFGIIVYGNGFVDSYGYIPGMKAKRLLESIADINPPLIKKYIDCYSYLNISENNLFDTGIDSIQILYTNNIKTDIPDYSLSPFSVNLKADLINQYEDGEAIIKAKDKKGLFTIDTLRLKGMTVSISSSPKNKVAYIGHIAKDTIVLKNYGKYKQTITTAYCSNNIYISVPQTYFPLSIPFGDSVQVPVVFGSYNLNKTIDTVILVDECGRKVKHQEIFESLPTEYLAVSDCNVPIRFTTNSSLEISFENNTIIVKNYKGSLEIYNIFGSLIMQKKIFKEAEILLDYLSTGLYLIRIDNKIYKIYKIK